MAKINLLPWRAERRRQREREFYMMLLGAFVAGLLGVLLWHLWMNARIDNQDERNQYLTDQIHQLDSKLVEIKNLEKTKSQLLARKQIIEKLQANRSQMVHLFDELVKTIPDSVRLTGMKQDGNTLTLDGVAQSNASVATYMRNLDQSPWMTRPDLQKTEANAGHRRDRYNFGLKVTLTSPEEKAKEQAKQQAEEGGTSASPTGENSGPATAPPAAKHSQQPGGKP